MSTTKKIAFSPSPLSANIHRFRLKEVFDILGYEYSDYPQLSALEDFLNQSTKKRMESEPENSVLSNKRHCPETTRGKSPVFISTIRLNING